MIPTLKMVTVIPPGFSGGRFTRMSGSLTPLTSLGGILLHNSYYIYLEVRGDDKQRLVADIAGNMH